MWRRAVLQSRPRPAGCSVQIESHRFAPIAVQLRHSAGYPAPRDGIRWKDLGFSLASRDTKMVIVTCEAGQKWGECRPEPYGALAIEPSATVLNYGQSIFEGLKAFRTTKGRIVMFRPQKNALRLSQGARRLLMPPVPSQLFMEACEMAVRENGDLVPPVGEGALYLRPLLFGSGADLGVKPSSAYTFVIYVSPVGKYFGPNSGGARMKLCAEYHRAAPFGVGHVKCAGNYAQCFGAQRDAKADGFSDVIYMDVNGEHIEEAAASNFFCVDSDKVVHTPQLGTILPGVTRDSVIQLVRRLSDEGLRLNVGRVPVQTVFNAKEAFLTGTGAGIIPIEHISSGEESVDFACPGPVTQIVSKALVDIQTERGPDTFNWLHDPFVDRPFGRDSYMEPNF
eukprot:TRINITY_DN17713_c0_g1_i1.p1 TRINITY_DN17713_c0_g1~~TRINITY_DN17713_c0_g1_i1.p1  ORF type:complete len:415 (+),score=81.49 TRINITY_DN17713_c0_g1_i1:63-1247(+)